jgi:hypothetical protein
MTIFSAGQRNSFVARNVAESTRPAQQPDSAKARVRETPRRTIGARYAARERETKS